MKQLLVDSNFLLEEGFPMKGEKKTPTLFIFSPDLKLQWLGNRLLCFLTREILKGKCIIIPRFLQRKHLSFKVCYLARVTFREQSLLDNLTCYWTDSLGKVGLAKTLIMVFICKIWIKYKIWKTRIKVRDMLNVSFEKFYLTFTINTWEVFFISILQIK